MHNPRREIKLLECLKNNGCLNLRPVQYAQYVLQNINNHRLILTICLDFNEPYVQRSHIQH